MGGNTMKKYVKNTALIIVSLSTLGSHLHSEAMGKFAAKVLATIGACSAFYSSANSYIKSKHIENSTYINKTPLPIVTQPQPQPQVIVISDKNSNNTKKTVLITGAIAVAYAGYDYFLGNGKTIKAVQDAAKKTRNYINDQITKQTKELKIFMQKQGKILINNLSRLITQSELRIKTELKAINENIKIMNQNQQNNNKTIQDKIDENSKKLDENSKKLDKILTILKQQ
jgi:Skp family chaperone for outer membrane proteins